MSMDGKYFRQFAIGEDIWQVGGNYSPVNMMSRFAYVDNLDDALKEVLEIKTEAIREYQDHFSRLIIPGLFTIICLTLGFGILKIGHPIAILIYNILMGASVWLFFVLSKRYKRYYESKLNLRAIEALQKDLIIESIMAKIKHNSKKRTPTTELPATS